VLSLTEPMGETVRMAQDRALATLDEATFGPMTEPLRRDLLLHCYRFTGSLHDAEDLVQETLVKAWRGRAAYRGEAGLRTWLRRIATRACLDALRRDPPRRTLPSATGQGAGGRMLWLEPLPDELLADVASDPAATYELRESVSLAFLVALQRLPPRQRAVLILRDVLALRASETAASLDISVSAVNSLLHRARRTMSTHYTPASAHSPQDAHTAGLLRRYIAAWEANDIDALMATLKADATLEMPPLPVASVGHAAIRAFLADGILDGSGDRWRGVTTEANGGPAVALYRRDGDRYLFTGLQLLTVDRELIARVTAYMDESLAVPFRLPDSLESRTITGSRRQ
jgi:RNA polymerase sigma-70 factor (ECF subfamily)